MLRPVLVTAPTVLPLSLADVKAQCRVDTSDDDALLTSLIGAAVSWCDGFAGILGKAMITQTWQQDFDGFISYGPPNIPMRMRVGNVLGITSVAYYDSNNATQTLASTVYQLFADEIGGYIDLKPAQSWPSSYGRPDAVRVTWTAGYGAAAASVPGAVLAALKLIVAHLYENRETVVIGQVQAVEVPFTVNALLAPFAAKRF